MQGLRLNLPTKGSLLQAFATYHYCMLLLFRRNAVNARLIRMWQLCFIFLPHLRYEVSHFLPWQIIIFSFNTKLLFQTFFHVHFLEKSFLEINSFSTFYWSAFESLLPISHISIHLTLSSISIIFLKRLVPIRSGFIKVFHNFNESTFIILPQFGFITINCLI